MSTIKTGTTLTTAYEVEGDTTGALVIQTGATPTTALTISSAQVATFAQAPVLPAASIPQAALAANVAGNGPSFSAYPSVTQSFGAGATTKVLFDTEEWDTNSNFSSSRFTPTIAGYYQINASMTAIYAAGESALFIHKNGAQNRTLLDMRGETLYMLSGSSVVYCNGSTDYIEIYVYTQNATTNYSGIGRGNFSGSLVRVA